jgi:DNA polymerase-3 subunit alpha
MNEFVHLHLHSQYSLLDGTIKIDDLVRKVGELRMPAVAVTDHGGMMGTIEFYEKATRAGIRPILGCEIYVAPGSRLDRKPMQGDERSYHMILLAESAAGYQNLIRLVSRAHVEGFYYKPRVDKEILREHAGGLIATSACLQGEIPRILAQEGRNAAAECVETYKDIFRDGRFFIEIQDNGLPEQNQANEELIRLAKTTGTPLVATNDCHYLERSGARVHDVLLCLQTGKTIHTEGRMRFASDQFYLKAPAEFEKAFGHSVPESLKNTLAIAERCSVKLDLGKNKIPAFQVPDGVKSEEEYLRHLTFEGLTRRFQEKARRGEKISAEEEKAYRKRLEYELSVIEQSGYSGYFLIVWDFIRHAKEMGIPVGPGRGSAAGSLVAFALRITEIDPIPYGLLFERFLNPERVSLPDVDCDFCKDRRDEVIAYIKERYGEANVTQIITFGTMKARAAVRDVGRVLEMPYAEVDRIAKLIPPDLGMTIDRAMQVEPRLKETIQENPKAAELFEYAKAIEGLSRHASTHAAGVVISNRPITEYVPLYRNSNGDITTQFSMKDIEKVGLVKFDVLGLRTLTAIHDTLRLLRQRGEALDLETIPLDDAETYEMLSRGDTPGVFQCESGGFTDLLVKLKPEKFAHLIHAVALYRPGPLQSGMVEDFIARRHGRKKTEYPFPEMEKILCDTYGVMVYQEQVMQIAVALAGFSMGEADVLRKAMGKKDTALMDKQKARFLKGAVAHGIPENKAQALFEQIAQFGEYGFNKSHSAAYAMVAYQTAYLKAHFPVEYFCALMTSESGDTAKILRYIGYCREKGIPILPPDANESRFAFFPSGKAIRFGLSAIKGVGEAAIQSIQEARGEEPFASAEDFLSRVDLHKVNKRALESLIKAGALDSLDPDRGRLFERLPSLMDAAQGEARRRESGQFNLFGGGAGPSAPAKEKRREAADPLWSRAERLRAEKETLGFYITGHPLDAYAAEIGMFASVTSSGIGSVKSGSEIKIAGIIAAIKEKTTKRGEKMAILSLEDLEGIAEVVVFPETYKAIRDDLATQAPILLIGRVETDETSTKVIAGEICRMENVRERLAKSVHLQLRMDRMTARDIAELRATLAKHSGDKKGFLHLVREGEYETVVALPDAFGIAPSMELAVELKGRFGYDVLRLR